MLLLFNQLFEVQIVLNLNSFKSDSYDVLFENSFSFIARRHRFSNILPALFDV